MNILLGFLTVVLVLLCLFLCLVILIQRPRQDSGLGAALGGGGMMESTFGAESGNLLTKLTIWCSSIFFVVGFLLYLGYLSLHQQKTEAAPALPAFAADPAAVPPPPTGQIGAPPAAGESPTVTLLPGGATAEPMPAPEGSLPGPTPTPTPAPAETAPTPTPAPTEPTPTPPAEAPAPAVPAPETPAPAPATPPGT